MIRLFNGTRARIGTIWTVLVLAGILLLSGGGVALAKNPAEDLIDNSVSQRWRNLEAAVALYGNPVLTNFPMRGALLKFTQRQDQLNTVWYTYLLPVSGQEGYYFTTTTYPESVCNFLGSTQDVRAIHEHVTEVTAPSWDGVFYGNCPDDEYFFFDVQSDAMMVFGGPIVHITSDRPLSLYATAKQVTVQQ